MAPGWASPPSSGTLSGQPSLDDPDSHPHPHPHPHSHSSTPALLSVTSPPSPSLVRRKPLPQNASPVIPSSHSRLSTLSSVTSFPGGDTPADPTASHSHSHSQSQSQSQSQSYLSATRYQYSSSPSSTPSSVHDDPSFVPRDLDRYVPPRLSALVLCCPLLFLPPTCSSVTAPN